jgi:chromosomal replication initiation ATPase DnaA
MAEFAPELTFENFSVDADNRFAHATATSAVEALGNYNPLVICGGEEVERNHLLHAIGNRVRQHDRGYTICFKDASIEADRRAGISVRSLESADMLVLANLDKLEGVEVVQKWLLEVFDLFHNAGKQIVFTTSVHPRLLTHFIGPLQSRLQWGIIAELNEVSTAPVVPPNAGAAGGASIIDSDHLWSKALTTIKTQISKPSFETWFLNTAGLWRDSIFEVVVPSRFVADWMKSRYCELVAESIAYHNGVRIAVDIVVDHVVVPQKAATKPEVVLETMPNSSTEQLLKEILYELKSLNANLKRTAKVSEY